MTTATKMKFRPIGDHVVIRRDDAAGKTAGGIILPESAKKRPKLGTVIAVGPGGIDTGLRIPLQVEPGDRVLFPGYAGTEVELGDQRYAVVRENEILSILE